MTRSGLHIEGRRWFQRTYGNTYHTVTIHRPNEPPVRLGPTYGYGDMFLQTAIAWLRGHGYPDAQNGTEYLREQLGGTYSVVDVTRQRDL